MAVLSLGPVPSGGNKSREIDKWSFLRFCFLVRRMSVGMDQVTVCLL